jgi:hypothetical protein
MCRIPVVLCVSETALWLTCLRDAWCPLQAMLNRLGDSGELKPLYRYRIDGPPTFFGPGGTPFLSDASGHFKGSGMQRHGTLSRGAFQRPTQLILPADEDSTIAVAEKMPSRAFTDSAIVFTMHAVRYGLFYGDDGKSVTVRPPFPTHLNSPCAGCIDRCIAPS